jgi:hypothetical protein
MSSENGKTVFEEAAAERELEELRRGIEEWRRRRRSANDAFDAFLKRFDESPQTAGDEPPAAVPVAAPKPATPPAAELPPRPELPPRHELAQRPREAPPAEGVQEADSEARDEGLLAFAPAASTAAPVPRRPEPPPPNQPSLADFAAEGPAPATAPELRSIPAALAPARRSPAGRIGPVIAIAAAVLLVAMFLWRGPSSDEAAPAAPASAPAATVPAAPPPAAAARTEPAPAAELTTIRRVWLRVTVDGARVVEREVPAETKIPLSAASQVVIRAGDAGAVRVAIGGKDQGPLGPAGQPATRTFTVK